MGEELNMVYYAIFYLHNLNVSLSIIEYRYLSALHLGVFFVLFFLLMNNLEKKLFL